MEECRLLAEARGTVEKKEMREWGTRHARDRKKKKEDLGKEKVREKEEGEKLASFFGAIYEFFNPIPVPIPAPIPVPVIPVVPVGHFISFVPALSPANDNPIVVPVNVVPVNALVLVALPARFVPAAFVPASSASFPTMVLQHTLLLKA